MPILKMSNTESATAPPRKLSVPYSSAPDPRLLNAVALRRPLQGAFYRSQGFQRCRLAEDRRRHAKLRAKRMRKVGEAGKRDLQRDSRHGQRCLCKQTLGASQALFAQVLG